MEVGDSGSVHSIETERVLLGAVLIRPAVMADLSLAPGDFYRAAHQAIWRNLQALHRRGAAIDTVTLCHRLEQTGRLEELGGHVYVASLTDGVPRSTNAPHYARLVREMAVQRRLAKLASGNPHPEEVVDLLDEWRELGTTGGGDGWMEDVITMDAVQAQPKAAVVARGLAFAGKITLLHAAPGAGKTTLATAVAAAVTADREFLGAPTIGGPVLWIGEDRDTTRNVAGQLDAALDRLHFTDGWALATDLKGRLTRLVEEIKPTLIVIDTLHRLGSVIGITSFSDPAAAGGYFVQVKAVAELPLAPAVLVLHHEPRAPLGKDRNGDSDGPKNEYAGRPRDSGAFEGESDIVIHYWRDDRQSHIVPGKRRESTTAEELTLELEGSGFRVVSSRDADGPKLGQPTTETVRKAIADAAEPLTEAQIVRAHGGDNERRRAAVRTAIGVLSEGGVIVGVDVPRGAVGKLYTGWKLK